MQAQQFMSSRSISPTLEIILQAEKTADARHAIVAAKSENVFPENIFSLWQDILTKRAEQAEQLDVKVIAVDTSSHTVTFIASKSGNARQYELEPVTGAGDSSAVDPLYHMRSRGAAEVPPQELILHLQTTLGLVPKTKTGRWHSYDFYRPEVAAKIEESKAAAHKKKEEGNEIKLADALALLKADATTPRMYFISDQERGVREAGIADGKLVIVPISKELPISSDTARYAEEILGLQAHKRKAGWGFYFENVRDAASASGRSGVLDDDRNRCEQEVMYRSLTSKMPHVSFISYSRERDRAHLRTYASTGNVDFYLKKTNDGYQVLLMPRFDVSQTILGYVDEGLKELAARPVPALRTVWVEHAKIPAFVERLSAAPKTTNSVSGKSALSAKLVDYRREHPQKGDAHNNNEKDEK